MTRYFRHRIIDNFLPAHLHGDLLAYALATREAFKPTQIYGVADEALQNVEVRKSLRSEKGLGALKQDFKGAVTDMLPGLLAELAVKPFETAGMEIELVAHPHGSHFRPHIDLRTDPRVEARTSERAVTLVYYFHRQPKGFTGGEIAILPLGPGDPLLVEPMDNRLVAFASFVPHAVEPVICHSGDFENSRFAVNCWVHKTAH